MTANFPQTFPRLYRPQRWRAQRLCARSTTARRSMKQIDAEETGTWVESEEPQRLSFPPQGNLFSAARRSGTLAWPGGQPDEEGAVRTGRMGPGWIPPTNFMFAAFCADHKQNIPASSITSRGRNTFLAILHSFPAFSVDNSGLG